MSWIFLDFHSSLVLQHHFFPHPAPLVIGGRSVTLIAVELLESLFALSVLCYWMKQENFLKRQSEILYLLSRRKHLLWVTQLLVQQTASDKFASAVVAIYYPLHWSWAWLRCHKVNDTDSFLTHALKKKKEKKNSISLATCHSALFTAVPKLSLSRSLAMTMSPKFCVGSPSKSHFRFERDNMNPSSIFR